MSISGDDDDFELGDDNFDMDMDFPDPFSSEEEEGFEGGRNPVSAVAGSLHKNAKSELLNPENIKTMVNDALPNEFSSSTEGVSDIIDSVEDTVDKVKKDVNPLINIIAKKADGLISDKHSRTKSLLGKIIGSTESDNRARQQEQSLEEKAMDAFNRSNDEIKETIEALESKDTSAKISEKTSLSNIQLLSEIAVGTNRLFDYNTKITAAYQRKSLELQYKLYFTARESLELNKGQRESIDTKLKSIIHNTGLPDFQKATLMEFNKEGVGREILTSLYSADGGIKDILKGVQQKVLDVTANSSMLEGLVEDSGDSPMTPSKLATSILAYLRGKASEGAKKVTSGNTTFAKYGAMAEGLMSDTSGTVQRAEYKLNSSDSNMYNYLGWVLGTARDFFERGTVKNNISYNDKAIGPIDGQSKYSKLTDKSITTVIPALLSKIHGEISMLRTGQDKVDLVQYDHNKNTLSTVSKVTDRLKNKSIKTIGDSGVVSQIGDLGATIAKIGGLGKEDIPALNKALLKRVQFGKGLRPENFETTGFYLGVMESRKENIKKAIDKFIEKTGYQGQSHVNDELKRARKLFPSLGKELFESSANGSIDNLTATGFISKGEDGTYTPSEENISKEVLSQVSRYVATPSSVEKKLTKDFSEQVKTGKEVLKEMGAKALKKIGLKNISNKIRSGASNLESFNTPNKPIQGPLNKDGEPIKASTSRVLGGIVSGMNTLASGVDSADKKIDEAKETLIKSSKEHIRAVYESTLVKAGVPESVVKEVADKNIGKLETMLRSMLANSQGALTPKSMKNILTKSTEFSKETYKEFKKDPSKFLKDVKENTTSTIENISNSVSDLSVGSVVNSVKTSVRMDGAEVIDDTRDMLGVGYGGVLPVGTVDLLSRNIHTLLNNSNEPNVRYSSKIEPYKFVPDKIKTVQEELKEEENKSLISTVGDLLNTINKSDTVKNLKEVVDTSTADLQETYKKDGVSGVATNIGTTISKKANEAKDSLSTTVDKLQETYEEDGFDGLKKLINREATATSSKAKRYLRRKKRSFLIKHKDKLQELHDISENKYIEYLDKFGIKPEDVESVITLNKGKVSNIGTTISKKANEAKDSLYTTVDNLQETYKKDGVSGVATNIGTTISSAVGKTVSHVSDNVTDKQNTIKQKVKPNRQELLDTLTDALDKSLKIGNNKKTTRTLRNAIGHIKSGAILNKEQRDKLVTIISDVNDEYTKLGNTPEDILDSSQSNDNIVSNETNEPTNVVNTETVPKDKKVGLVSSIVNNAKNRLPKLDDILGKDVTYIGESSSNKVSGVVNNVKKTIVEKVPKINKNTSSSGINNKILEELSNVHATMKDYFNKSVKSSLENEEHLEKNEEVADKTLTFFNKIKSFIGFKDVDPEENDKAVLENRHVETTGTLSKIHKAILGTNKRVDNLTKLMKDKEFIIREGDIINNPKRMGLFGGIYKLLKTAVITSAGALSLSSSIVGNLATGAGNLLGSLGSLLNPFGLLKAAGSVVGSVGSGLLKGIAGAGAAVLKAPFRLFRKRSQDVYRATDNVLLLRANLMDAGLYINVNTSKRVKSIRDIKGEVRDLDNNVVLTITDIVNGLVDKNGKELVIGPKRTLLMKGLLLPFKLLGKAGKIGKKTIGAGLSFMGDVINLRKGFKYRPMDVYSRIDGRQIFRANLMESGFYLDANTRKPIRSVSDIKGEVIDKRGHTILNFDDIYGGLMDNMGDEVKTGARRGFISSIASVGKLISKPIRKVFKFLTVGRGQTIDIRSRLTNKILLRASLMKSGFYIDERTGKVIRKINDITGNVVDVNNKIHLTVSDIEDGLVDESGNNVIIDISKNYSGTKGKTGGIFNKLTGRKSKGKKTDSVDTLKDIFNVIKDRVPDNIKKYQNTKMDLARNTYNVINNIFKILKSSTKKKKILGDSDDDGTRDLGWRERLGNLVDSGSSEKDKSKSTTNKKNSGKTIKTGTGNKSKGLINMLSGVGKGILGTLGITALITGIKSSVIELSDEFVKSIGSLGSKIKDGVFKAVGGIVDKVGPMLTNLKDKVFKFASKAGSVVKDAVFSVGKKAKDFGIEALEKAKKLGGKVAGFFKNNKVMKLIAKVGLKKIPVVGALVGGYLAYQLMKKGDMEGAMLELGSGLMGAVGLGIPALALDAKLATRKKKETDKVTEKAPVDTTKEDTLRELDKRTKLKEEATRVRNESLRPKDVAKDTNVQDRIDISNNYLHSINETLQASLKVQGMILDKIDSKEVNESKKIEEEKLKEETNRLNSRKYVKPLLGEVISMRHKVVM